MIRWLLAFWDAYLAKTMASTDNSELIVPVHAPVSPQIAPQQTQPVVFTPAGFHPKIVAWGHAIEHWEGASLASNNPGNLKYSTLTKSWGATKGRPASDGGFLCQFPSHADGFIALCNFLTLGAEGQLIISHPLPCTIEQFTVRYAGNPPQGYKTGIYTMLGVIPTTDIATFLT